MTRMMTGSALARWYPQPSLKISLALLRLTRPPSPWSRRPRQGQRRHQLVSLHLLWTDAT